MAKLRTTYTLWSNFSCVRQLKKSQFSNEENLSYYFDDFSEHPIGNDFKVEVTLSQLKRGHNNLNLKNELNYWGQGPINERVEFLEVIPTLENIAKTIGQRLVLKGWKIIRVKVIDEPGKSASYDFFKNEFTYTKGFKINCIHRHHNPDLTTEENLQLYNKCSKVHGHEYRLEVSVACRALNSFGLVMNRSQLDHIVNNQIVRPFDKTYLNEKIGNTSGEIICDEFFKRLKPHLTQLSKLKVYETRKNSFEVSNSQSN